MTAPEPTAWAMGRADAIVDNEAYDGRFGLWCAEPLRREIALALDAARSEATAQADATIAGMVADLREREANLRASARVARQSGAEDNASEWITVANVLRAIADTYARGPTAEALARHDARIREVAMLDRDHTDADIRRLYAARLGILDANDTPPCWDDIVEAARTSGAEAAILGLNGDHALLSTLRQLADAADHLHTAHNCDAHGWEVWRDAARRARECAAAIEGSHLPKPEKTE